MRGNRLATARRVRIIPWRLLATLLVGVAVAPACPAAGAFELTQVAQGIYVHHGVNQDYTKANHGGIANVGFIVGNKCVAVIDPGGSLWEGKQLREAIGRTTKVPICYVIYSHIHPDHVLGGRAFVRDHPEFIAHFRADQAILNNQEYFAQHFLAPIGEKVKGDPIVVPTKLVKSTLDLDLGGRVLTLTAYPPAHTDTDLTIYDHKTQTLWVADLLFVNRVPALDGDLKGWLSVIKELKKVKAARAIPGHGPVSVPWPSALNAEQHYLEMLLHQTRALIAKGGTLEEALDKVCASQKGKWLLFDEYNKRNVTKAFTQLEWE